jgi:hypothetical protein
LHGAIINIEQCEILWHRRIGPAIFESRFSSFLPRLDTRDDAIPEKQQKMYRRFQIARVDWGPMSQAFVVARRRIGRKPLKMVVKIEYMLIICQNVW